MFKLCGILFAVGVLQSLNASPLNVDVLEKWDDDPMETMESVRMPMVYSNNFDMIMPYDHSLHPHHKMVMQNFDKFVESKMRPGYEMDMNESTLLDSTVKVRVPKPLSEMEEQVRKMNEIADSHHERKIQQRFKKGSVKPSAGDRQWEHFDYDAYLG